ncbi:MAG: hypothetical protein NTW79_01980 [Candidatus Berkelbacteria bacterium]|nr:hypothetical protein [Candidatus Berkelbacteria bacterium]
MSKKNKNKKKKQKIQKRVSNFSSSAVEVVAEKVADENQAEKFDLTAKVPTTVEESDSIIDEKSQRFISRDVKIIILTIVILAILLTTAKFLQLKTGIINHFADWLFKIAHIQTS